MKWFLLVGVVALFGCAGNDFSEARIKEVVEGYIWSDGGSIAIVASLEGGGEAAIKLNRGLEPGMATLTINGSEVLPLSDREEILLRELDDWVFISSDGLTLVQIKSLYFKGMNESGGLFNSIVVISFIEAVCMERADEGAVYDLCRRYLGDEAIDLPVT